MLTVGVQYAQDWNLTFADLQASSLTTELSCNPMGS